MKDWEALEEEIYNYLKIEMHDCEIQKLGGGDSTVSDIVVIKNDKRIVIEAKLSPSHAGQFTLDKKNEKFTTISENNYAQKILEYLNDNIENYENVKQTSIEVPIEESLCFSFIRQHYMDKGTTHFYVTNKKRKYKAFFQLSEMEKFLSVKVVLRRKKSGSSDLPKKESVDIKEKFKNLLLRSNIEIEWAEEYDSFITSHNEISNNLNILEGYYISKKGGAGYKLRKKSKTNNITCLFVLKYNGPKNQTTSYEEIKKALEESNL